MINLLRRIMRRRVAKGVAAGSNQGLRHPHHRRYELSAAVIDSVSSIIDAGVEKLAGLRAKDDTANYVVSRRELIVQVYRLLTSAPEGNMRKAEDERQQAIGGVKQQAIKEVKQRARK